MKSIKIYFHGLLLSGAFALTSCEETMVNPGHTQPEANFQYAWEKFDQHYGLFLVKNVNWNEVYDTHLPIAQAAQNDAELFSVLSSMIRTLNDKHVNIYSTDPVLRDYNSGTDGPSPAQEDFLFDVIEDNYLSEYHQLSDEMGYGRLEGNLGYIHLSAFKKELKQAKPIVEKIMDALHNSDGIIVDIRDHKGGDDRVSKYIAGRFASSRNLFMTTKKRNGPQHDDFDSTIEWYVEPTGDKQFTKPVILLTSAHSISAGETFTLAMKKNINVKQVGDTTAGAFSDQVFFEIPNGWMISVGVGDYRAADGKSYEGLGIAPDVYSRNEKSELMNGTDKTLEKAISILR